MKPEVGTQAILTCQHCGREREQVYAEVGDTFADMVCATCGTTNWVNWRTGECGAGSRAAE